MSKELYDEIADVLELAFAATASTIVSSDSDLLVLHRWRGIRILRQAEYLAAETA